MERLRFFFGQSHIKQIFDFVGYVSILKLKKIF